MLLVLLVLGPLLVVVVLVLQAAVYTGMNPFYSYKTYLTLVPSSCPLLAVWIDVDACGHLYPLPTRA